MFSDLHLCLWFGILIRDWPWHRRDAPPPLRTLNFRLGLFGMWSLRDCMDPMCQSFLLHVQKKYIVERCECKKIHHTCLVGFSGKVTPIPADISQTLGMEKHLEWTSPERVGLLISLPIQKRARSHPQNHFGKTCTKLNIEPNEFNETFSSGPCSSSHVFSFRWCILLP